MAASLEGQWNAFTSNLGIFHGSLASYDGSASQTSRGPTVIHIFSEDVASASTGALPRSISITLRRCSTQKDVTQFYLNSMDLISRGFLIGPAGSICSGNAVLSRGAAVFLEQCVNHRTDGAGDIVGRARIVTIYDDEHRFSRFSVFREAALSVERPVPPPPPPPSSVPENVASADLLTTTMEVSSLTDIQGLWIAEETLYDRIKREATSVQSKMSIQREEAGFSFLYNGQKVANSANGNESDSIVPLQSAEGIPYYLIFIPGGLTLSVPLTLDLSSNFHIETTWYLSPSERLRIRRVYDKGEWKSSIFSRDTRQS